MYCSRQISKTTEKMLSAWAEVGAAAAKFNSFRISPAMETNVQAYITRFATIRPTGFWQPFGVILRRPM
jgi:hypothetical protein